MVAMTKREGTGGKPGLWDATVRCMELMAARYLVNASFVGAFAK